MVELSAPNNTLTSRGRINISKLKRFVLENFPRDWVIFQVLLSEDDEMDVQTFLARLPLYLKLSRFKRGSGK